MSRVLFLCGKARMRSPTAAAIASEWVETDFAGLSNDADVPLEREQVEWADQILVMEARHAKRLKTLFPDRLVRRRVVVLGIPDHAGFMDPRLVAKLTPLLEARFAR